MYIKCVVVRVRAHIHFKKVDKRGQVTPSTLQITTVTTSTLQLLLVLKAPLHEQLVSVEFLRCIEEAINESISPMDNGPNLDQQTRMAMSFCIRTRGKQYIYSCHYDDSESGKLNFDMSEPQNFLQQKWKLSKHRCFSLWF